MLTALKEPSANFLYINLHASYPEIFFLIIGGIHIVMPGTTSVIHLIKHAIPVNGIPLRDHSLDGSALIVQHAGEQTHIPIDDN